MFRSYVPDPYSWHIFLCVYARRTSDSSHWINLAICICGDLNRQPPFVVSDFYLTEWILLFDSMGVRFLNPEDTRLSPIWYSTQKLFAINQIEEMVSTCLLENTSGPKKDLKEAPCCNMLQTGILMNYPRSTTSSNQSFRIIHCDNTQPGSSINWCGFTTSYMFTPKGIDRSQSIVIYCAWKPRAKHISNSFAFHQDAKEKLYIHNPDSFTTRNCINMYKLS